MRKAAAFVAWALGAHFVAITLDTLLLLAVYDPVTRTPNPVVGPPHSAAYYLFFLSIFFGLRPFLRRRRSRREAITTVA